VTFHIPVLFVTTLTTVLHNCADCDYRKVLQDMICINSFLLTESSTREIVYLIMLCMLNLLTHL